ncbi:hypothetical protein B0T16DRAFT_463075 [Cercophora newfieldiana]|uniref:Cytochrome P450 n=1 Tax=Cercophora newfieldiana TaxID=92897 RepID=A0AA39XSF1_9PEZI|nr:hypothetical protein B0T16DRAFT_463075 [Cercophora newfieldiana]
MLTSTAIVSSLAILLVYLVQAWKNPDNRETSEKEESNIGKEIDEARNTIDFSYANSPSLEERLALRAQPNQRLVSAFGVTNSLTTNSPEVHRKFLKLASTIITARVPNHDGSDTRWLNLYTAASNLLQDELNTATATIPLASLIQRLCLTLVLHDNFHTPLSSLPRSTILLIASEINTQWLLSKCSPSTPPSSVLHAALVSLSLPLSPADTLSLIMPQYETLWRVVLLTFLTAYHLQHSPSMASRTASVPSCLGTKSPDETLALHIADEALRLYPSNKSIYRATADFSGVMSADIQRCHRDERIWGSNALEFKPERFEWLTEWQRRAYFPYSLGRHRCPAYGGFGNRMITLLVVVLGREMGRDKGRVRFGDEGLDQDGKKRKRVLSTGREDMGGWVFELGHLGW